MRFAMIVVTSSLVEIIDLTKVTSKSYSPLWCFDCNFVFHRYFRSFYLETLWHCDTAISLMHRGQYSTKLLTIFDNSQILLSGSNAIRCAGPSTRKGIALSVLGECCCINSTAPPPPHPPTPTPTPPLWTKWPAFRRRYFQMYFSERKALYFDWNFTEVCSEGSNFH